MKTMADEVFGIAAGFGTAIHLIAEIGSLKHEICKLQSTCGSCEHWMKSRICPREKNVNGYSRGPGCDAPVCKLFVMSGSMAELIKEKQHAIEEIKRHLAGPGWTAAGF